MHKSATILCLTGSNILSMKKQIPICVLVGGSLQVGLTFLLIFIIAEQFGQPFGEAVFIGFLVALSSTAIVLKILQERAEVDSPHGRTTLGILIFQDIIIVPMMLFTPMLAGEAENVAQSLIVLFGKGALIIILVLVSARWVVPRVLYQIAKTNNREIFLLSIIGIGLAVAWLTSSVGLSLALGAFMAGLIISESEYSHQAMGNVLPFRDVFISFFFVSIGMLLDLNFLFSQLPLVLLITLSLLIVKAFVASLATIILGFPLRTAILVGLGLSQIGEFSFILSKTGLQYGLLAGDIYQLFLSVSILTMAFTPFIISFAPKGADLALKLPVPNKIKLGFCPVEEEKSVGKEDHLVVIGYGLNGKNLVRAASVANISYAIVEMNPETVRGEARKGIPIFYGDASQQEVLEHVDIDKARVAVIAISDPLASRRITEISRRLNPSLYIIVRTRYLNELELLLELGANEVIPEEFETSIEIFARVLSKYLVPRDEIEEFITEVRADGYEMFRSLSRDTGSLARLKTKLPGTDIVTFRIDENSLLAGKTLDEMELRREHKVTVLAVSRESEMIYNPCGDTKIMPQDLLVVIGLHEDITDFAKLTREK